MSLLLLLIIVDHCQFNGQSRWSYQCQVTGGSQTPNPSNQSCTAAGSDPYSPLPSFRVSFCLLSLLLCCVSCDFFIVVIVAIALDPPTTCPATRSQPIRDPPMTRVVKCSRAACDSHPSPSPIRLQPAPEQGRQKDWRASRGSLSCPKSP